MIAPLDIERMVVHQAVHNFCRAAATVKDVSHKMQVIDCQTFDECRERADKVVGRVGLENRVDDALVIANAVVVFIRVRMQQLIDDIGVIVRDGLTDFGARVATRKGARHGDEMVEILFVPGGGVPSRRTHQAQLFAWIVDERAQVALFAVGQRIAEYFVNVLANNARAVVEDVHEGFVFTVQVTHKVLGSFGQIENRLQVDDFGEDRLLVGKLLREQREVLHGLFGTFCSDH